MARPPFDKKSIFSIRVENPFTGELEEVDKLEVVDSITKSDAVITHRDPFSGVEEEVEIAPVRPSFRIRSCKELLVKSNVSVAEPRSMDLDGLPEFDSFKTLPRIFSCGFSGLEMEPSDTEGSFRIPTDSIATMNQFVLNAVVRQVFANFKIAIDIGKNPAQILKDHGIGFFSRGISSRFAYQPIGAMPAKAISDLLQERGHSPLSATLAAGFYETVVGTYLEARSAVSTFGMGSVTEAAKKAALPFFARNCLGWVAISFPYESTTDRVLTGLAAGIVSAFPDSIGNKMMMREFAVGTSFKEILSAGFNDAIKDIIANPRKFAIAAGIRGAGASLTAVLLAKETHEAILSALGEKPTVPSTEVKPVEVKKGKEDDGRGDDSRR